MRFAKLLVLLAVGIIGIILGMTILKLRVFPIQYFEPTALSLADTYRTIRHPESARKRSETVDFSFADTTDVGKYDYDKVFDSKYLNGQLNVPAHVFHPVEAEGAVLPLLERHPSLVEGAAVLEIGTGSGIVSLYAAQLGARTVVSTDISELAVATASNNASQLGFAEVMEVRLVPPEDMSAYSVIKDGEKFDLIISNPPYVLDLDAPENTAAIESGDLGFSIIDGLDQRLTDDGQALLYYASKFYHETIVKYARFKGYDVRNNLSMVLYSWEAEALFNSYLQRLLEYRGIDKNAFEFDYEKDYSLNMKFMGNRALRPADIEFDPLFPGESRWNFYPGWIVISKAK